MQKYKNFPLVKQQYLIDFLQSCTLTFSRKVNAFTLIKKNGRHIWSHVNLALWNIIFVSTTCSFLLFQQIYYVLLFLTASQFWHQIVSFFSGQLLGCLKDKDTIVRWSAAKGLVQTSESLSWFNIPICVYMHMCALSEMKKMSELT